MFLVGLRPNQHTNQCSYIQCRDLRRYGDIAASPAVAPAQTARDCGSAQWGGCIPSLALHLFAPGLHAETIGRYRAANSGFGVTGSQCKAFAGRVGRALLGFREAAW